MPCRGAAAALFAALLTVLSQSAMGQADNATIQRESDNSTTTMRRNACKEIGCSSPGWLIDTCGCTHDCVLHGTCCDDYRHTCKPHPPPGLVPVEFVLVLVVALTPVVVLAAALRGCHCCADSTGEAEGGAAPMGRPGKRTYGCCWWPRQELQQQNPGLGV